MGVGGLGIFIGFNFEFYAIFEKTLKILYTIFV